MPNQINEIVIGPIFPLQTDGILKVEEFGKNPFKIVNKYVYPNFRTHMITLYVLTATPYIIKPGALLTSLCLSTIGSILDGLEGKITHSL